jgi:catechol 2,3-dioxygenase-like lactoylglutathione lyase family enzyme
MITGLHTIIYTRDADKTRAFLRDVLGFKHVDAGEGWLIFKMPPAEMGVHPADDQTSGRHQLYFMCDDVKRTVQELEAKGVEFTGDITDHGWGILTTIKVPGGADIGLYQPRHPTALSL